MTKYEQLITEANKCIWEASELLTKAYGLNKEAIELSIKEAEDEHEVR